MHRGFAGLMFLVGLFSSRRINGGAVFWGDIP
jgi:hypothetical protein